MTSLYARSWIRMQTVGTMFPRVLDPTSFAVSRKFYVFDFLCVRMCFRVYT